MTLELRCSAGLLILLALLVTPALAMRAGSSPQLVAEGPAPPGGEVELAIHMRRLRRPARRSPDPGDAGLPMDVEWQLPAGLFSRAAALSGADAARDLVGLMNYVYERDYAVLVRLKVLLCDDAALADPRRRPLARLHRQALRSRTGRIRARPAGRHWNPERARFDERRRLLPRPLATLAAFQSYADIYRVAISLPRTVTVRDPYVFPIDDGIVDYAAPQEFFPAIRTRQRLHKKKLS